MNSSNTAHPETDVPVCGYVISAPWRSSGKTLVSIGLARAARRRSHAVRTFKKGPDYIDPLWLAAASGSGCYNLDPYVQHEDELVTTFRNHTNRQALALVEGTMGLHDGLRSDGADSNAAIARLLDLPVILVVDCRGMHRTVAALVNGIVQFDSNTRFAGIILNRIRSSRHEGKICSAIDEYCDTNVVGVIPETRSIHIDEQELGLTPAPELDRDSQQSDTTDSQSNTCIDAAADLVSEHCNLDELFQGVPTPSLIDKRTPAPKPVRKRPVATDIRKPALRIGLAKDEAFHFYYQDDLDTLRDRGVELIELSPLHDDMPADLDGLIVGGGFPERHARALENNQRFRLALQSQIKQGLVVHAECAGLMYLCRSLILDDGNFAMVGCIDADVTMGRKPVGRGYVQLQRKTVQLQGNTGQSGKSCDEISDEQGRLQQKVICAHEFHHSRIVFDESSSSNAYRSFSYHVLRGYGIDGKSDGIVCENAHASYAHFRHTRANPWLDSFLQRVIDARQQRYSRNVVPVSANR